MELKTQKLIRWSSYHALAILTATIFGIIAGNYFIIIFIGSVSFLFFVRLQSGKWITDKSFGQANLITLSRLVGILLLGIVGSVLPNVVISAAGFILLTLDGVDGWVAKKQNEISEFGEYFDKETDAFFLLILCILVIWKGLAGVWILTAGLLRYIFVALMFIRKTDVLKETKSEEAQLIYVVVMGLLLVCFLPATFISHVLATGALLLLLYSFFGDFRWLFSKK